MTPELLNLARAHAPFLFVSLPFLGAALAAFVARPRGSWLIATFTSILSAVLAVDLSMRMFLGMQADGVAAEGPRLDTDGFTDFGAVLISLLSAVTMISAISFTRSKDRGGAFAPSLGLCLAGAWTGAVLANDFVSLFVFTEIAWISSIGVVALSAAEKRAPLNGALRMLAFGGAAAAILLLGAALLARGLGDSTTLALTNHRAPAPRVAAVGLLLVTVALSWKTGLAPFNNWTAATLSRGSGFATLAVGAVGMTGAALVLGRVVALALSAPSIGTGVGLGLSFLGVASAIIGSIQALGATSFWRLIAYSSAAQLGCAVLGVALGSPAGLEAAFVQFAAASAAVIVLLGAGFVSGVGASISSLDGLGRRAPLAGAAITIAALSLMGAPLTLSFLGRWRLVEAALGIGWWWAAAAGIAVSLAGSYYGGRLIERVYFRHASTSSDAAAEGLRMKIALAPGILAGLIAIIAAIEPTALLRVVSAASQSFVDRPQ